MDKWQRISLRADETGSSARNSCSALQTRPCKPTLFLSLSFLLKFLKFSLAPPWFWRRWGVVLLLARTGALGGAPDVLLQSCGPQHLWHFSMHPALVHFIYNQSTFQTQSENQPLFCFFCFFTSFSLSVFLSLWVVALIENANCNQISWIKMSGLKMGDMSDNSHGSAWEMKRLAEIMGMWVWSVYELLMVCFGRQFGWSLLPS